MLFMVLMLHVFHTHIHTHTLHKTDIVINLYITVFKEDYKESKPALLTPLLY